ENAWPAICPEASGAIGGMETQAWAFAQALQRLHVCQVSFVVCAPDRFQRRVVQDITVLNRPAFIENLRRDVAQRCTISHRPPFLRLQRWSPSLLWKLPLLAATRPFRSDEAERELRRRFYQGIDADVIVTYGANRISTDVISAARKAGHRGVISCASNDDLREEFVPGSTFVNDYGEPAHDVARGLTEADAIFVQTEWQQQLAKTNLGRDAFVLPNPISPQWTQWAADAAQLLTDAGLPPTQLPEQFVLWTGRTDRFHKRPAMALQVAAALPAIPFLMVLNVTNQEIEQELRDTAPANVQFLAPLPHPAFIALISRAAVFLNTGSIEHEGFPNVFLQAGQLGVPVASAICDFGILSETGIGRACRDDLPSLVRCVQEMLLQPRENHCRQLHDRFGEEVVARTFFQLIQRVAAANGPETK
ncbi:MAG: glycosyltransferase, partial [Planctomycetaceae bacterium]|nr:glycosyltransferase [Planctomycetaceae bacterium]